MPGRKKYTRRKFIQIAGTVAGASAVSMALSACADTATPGTTLSLNSTATAGTTATAGVTSTVSSGPTPTALAVPTPQVTSQKPDSYLLLAPALLRPGFNEKVSVTLFNKKDLATDTVQVQLTRSGKIEAQASGQINGRGELTLLLADNLAEGQYNLELKGSNFLQQTTVMVEPAVLLFIETDKPIYKPGQTIQARLLTLNSGLKPVQNQKVVVEITEAKGSKIFKKTVQTDDYGMGRFEMPLSSEPNLGNWKINATLDKRKTTLDFKVEKYVLPKYKIEVLPTSEWLLLGEKITGKVKADYTFGKPVQGDLEIKAFRLEGSTWRQFATVTKEIDGEAAYDLPALQTASTAQQYDPATGQPIISRSPNVRLDVTVKEKNTSYEETTSRSLVALNTPVALKLLTESYVFKPGLPFNVLVASQDPDNKPVEANVTLTVSYMMGNYQNKQETRRTDLREGPVTLEFTPPADALNMSITATAQVSLKNRPSNGRNYPSNATIFRQAAYSPSGNFISVRQAGKAPFKAGDTLQFKVAATSAVAGGFFWEAVAGDGKAVQSGFTTTNEVSFKADAALAPNARLLVYQTTSDGELVADYLPFSVEGAFPHKVQAEFDKKQTEPGQPVNLKVQTDGQAKVGLALVDRAVYILGENRLNLTQVLGELGKLQKKPTLETAVSMPYGQIKTYGSKELLAATGLVALTNKKLPSGQTVTIAPPPMAAGGVGGAGAPIPAGRGDANAAAAPTVVAAVEQDSAKATSAGEPGLATVERVRQYFPETWLWDNQLTDANGLFTKKMDTPDSITTWTLNAVALSPKTGLGITQTELQVIQPFFVQVDTVYSAIRSEEFPVNVALYNYTTQAEKFFVDLDKSDWFDGLSDFQQTVIVQPNDVGSVSFKIRPKDLGSRQLKVTARSTSRADAIIKDLLIEPEGIAREVVDNVVLVPGKSVELDLNVPAGFVAGSARSSISVTGNFMTQSIEGLDNLLKMPYGCGEQNMILCAPNVYISSYLRASGQSKPELQSKIENLLLTGYQRELTYQRTDGSFSAFGNSDKQGSLWLSAFVLKTFSQARDLIYIDEAVLQKTATWIGQQQKPNGSFEPVGFVHHSELMGGLSNNTALTAYIAVALLEFGEKQRSAQALKYLESNVDTLTDVYSLGQTAYALGLGKSAKAGDAVKKLLSLGKASENGLYWGDSAAVNPQGQQGQQGARPGQPQPHTYNKSAMIETSGYGLLALSTNGDKIDGAQVARWLVSQRNAYGGWSSTQDTVVGLAALSTFIANGKSDVAGTVVMQGTNWQKEAKISGDNADVLQQFDAPLSKVNVEFKGQGQALLQAVRRYNEPKAGPANAAFKLNVVYGATELVLGKPLSVQAQVEYTPPEQVPAGMVVLEVALPTGFVADGSAIELLKQQPKVKRIDQSGRRVQIYIEDMTPGEKLSYQLNAAALYPVKAQAVASQVYAYYRTEWLAESLGGAITVK